MVGRWWWVGWQVVWCLFVVGKTHPRSCAPMLWSWSSRIQIVVGGLNRRSLHSMTLCKPSSSRNRGLRNLNHIGLNLVNTWRSFQHRKRMPLSMSGWMAPELQAWMFLQDAKVGTSELIAAQAQWDEWQTWVTKLVIWTQQALLWTELPKQPQSRSFQNSHILSLFLFSMGLDPLRAKDPIVVSQWKRRTPMMKQELRQLMMMDLMMMTWMRLLESSDFWSLGLTPTPREQSQKPRQLPSKQHQPEHQRLLQRPRRKLPPETQKLLGRQTESEKLTRLRPGAVDESLLSLSLNIPYIQDDVCSGCVDCSFCFELCPASSLVSSRRHSKKTAGWWRLWTRPSQHRRRSRSYEQSWSWIIDRIPAAVRGVFDFGATSCRWWFQEVLSGDADQSWFLGAGFAAEEEESFSPNQQGERPLLPRHGGAGGKDQGAQPFHQMHLVVPFSLVWVDGADVLFFNFLFSRMQSVTILYPANQFHSVHSFWCLLRFARNFKIGCQDEHAQRSWPSCWRRCEIQLGRSSESIQILDFWRREAMQLGVAGFNDVRDHPSALQRAHHRSSWLSQFLACMLFTAAHETGEEHWCEVEGDVTTVCFLVSVLSFNLTL